MSKTAPLLLETPISVRPDAKRRGRPPLDPKVRRQRILDVASRLFTANGYTETTVDAVGKAAGVTKRTIYELVGDKDALFRAVCINSHANIGEFRLDLPISGKSLRSNLVELAHRLIAHTLDDETIRVGRMIVVESMRFPDLIRDVTRSGRTSLNVKIAVVFDKLVELGLVGSIDAYRATEIFFDLVVGNIGFRKSMGFDEPMPTDNETEERVDVFIDGYLRRHGLVDV